MAEKNFKYRDELEQVLLEHHVKKEDICLVGSMALSLKGIREHGDIDFCAAGELRERLQEKVKKNYLSDNINLVVGKYERLLGISDSDLIKDSRYHEIIEGFKVIRLEIEFSAKLVRKWKKDLTDLPLIEQFIVNCSRWDWDLVIIEIANPKEKKMSRRKRITKFMVKAIKDPGYAKERLIKKLKDRKKMKQKHVEPSEQLKDMLQLKIDTGALLGSQFINGEFNRYDIILRYLTVKSVVEGINDDMMKFYKLMQDKRKRRDADLKILKLIESIERRGYLNRFPIPITNNGLLINGAHRLACALYYEVPEMVVEVKVEPEPIRFGRNWFEEQGFEEFILFKMDQTKEELFKKNGVWFSILLWPPAYEWFDEIEAWLRSNYKVTWKDDLFLGDNFIDFTREIYAIDDIDLWKVERKIHVMKKYSPHLRVFAVEISDPKFRMKKRTSSYLSDTGAKLKALIRNNYKHKVPGYIYDIICHTGDNHEHNRELFRIIEAYSAKDKAIV